MASFLPMVYTTASPSVSDEEFNSFHSIDRKLYTQLIVNLSRDPSESMQVVAFLLWLEQEVVDNLTLINQMLALPPTLINELADESVMCLKCVESDSFPFREKNPHHELVLLPNFVERNVSFQYFYGNRIAVLRGVSKFIGEVCSRAFRDLLEKNIHGTRVFKTAANVVYTPIPARHNSPPPMVMEKVNGEMSISSFGTIPRSHGTSITGHVTINPMINPQPVHKSSSVYEVGNGSSNVAVVGNGSSNGVVNVVAGPYNYPYWVQVYNGVPIGGTIETLMFLEKQMKENELCHMLKTSLNGLMEENDDHEVSPDERTIFLTFSKGYPISESEVREFFTRKFGDFIEAIHMQEVPPNEQTLYARVIAKSPSALGAVVEGGRAKYTINGKHVWARKYVRKQKSPPRNDAGFSLQEMNII